jgi:hypothetical protein
MPMRIEELEDQLALLVERQQPPGDDARQRVSAIVGRHRRRRAATAAAALALVATLAALVITSRSSTTHVVTQPRPSMPWTTYAVSLPWTFSYPPSWHLQTYDHCDQRGTVVANRPVDVAFPTIPNGCTQAQDLSHLPADYVGVGVDLRSNSVPPGGLIGTLRRVDVLETSLPLSAAQLRPQPSNNPSITVGRATVGAGGRNPVYGVTLYRGAQASAVDVAAATRVLASVAFGLIYDFPLTKAEVLTRFRLLNVQPYPASPFVRLDRIEVKKMTSGQFWSALLRSDDGKGVGPGSRPPPDSIVFVLAASGDIRQPEVGAANGVAVSDRYRWTLKVIDAKGAPVFGIESPTGVWPSVFDLLPDQPG